MNFVDSLVYETFCGDESGHTAFSNSSNHQRLFHSIQSENQDRQKTRMYYDSLLVARRSRLREECEMDKSSRSEIMVLSETLAKYKMQHHEARNRVESFGETFKEKKIKIEDKIKSCYQDLETLDEQEKALLTKIGFKGKILVECVESIEEYSRKVEKGATAYSPLVSILNGEFIFHL